MLHSQSLTELIGRKSSYFNYLHERGEKNPVNIQKNKLQNFTLKNVVNLERKSKMLALNRFIFCVNYSRTEEKGTVKSHLGRALTTPQEFL